MSLYDLDKKDVDIEALAQKALPDKNLLQELLDGVLSKDHIIRSNCFRVLTLLSEDHGEFLYPKWEYFQEMLTSSNSYHKNIAINLLANLTTVDVDNKFEAIFEDYYGILAGDKAMNACHVALNSSKIALNKPELKSEIINKLLSVDDIHQGKQKELIKAYVIETLLNIYPEAEDKQRIENFVKSQLDSKSPKTRNMAQCFLDRI
jgi:peptidyl-tRNA hydrolase